MSLGGGTVSFKLTSVSKPGRPSKWGAAVLVAAALVAPSRSTSAASAARVQEVHGTGTTSASATLASTTNHNLLVAILQFNNNGSITAPSNWQLAVRQSPDNNVGVAIYYYPNNPGSITSVSFTVTS